ncbi:MAG: transposase, OrfB family [Eubacterium sp.]|nr:transposase, OrfB family [Eubacterium sp.]
MILALKVRLEPNKKQLSKLFQSAGVARWAYNWTLAKQEENLKNGGKFIKDGDLRKELTPLKQTEEYKWLGNYSNNITKQAVKDVCDAYYMFFKKLSDKPKFKSRKKGTPKFYQDTEKIKFKDGKVRFEKIGWIRLSEKERIPENARYKNPRVKFDGIHWYISVGIETEQEQVELTGVSIGIDVGLKDLAVCSNIDNPFKNVNKTKKVKKLEKKLCRLQRKVSNKYEKNKEGRSYVKTNNILKLEKNIRKVHKCLDNIRTDYRHKVTTEIVKTKPSRIVIESLDVSSLMKNKHLSKSIQQQGLFELSKLIQYKSKKQGTEFVKADKWYPSSKICSVCGHVKTKLLLSEREFKCECCGAVIDRDKNASINLSRYAVSKETLVS